MRAAGLAPILAVAAVLTLASCGEERVDVEAPAHDVAAAADLGGVHVEMHQAPG